ncbi:hypothetical protein V6N11_003960 [Hibiscus sabdariffa]|uniref:MaoC-like domain-containing protein n=1 Tax=Hibiscus sabdariffa TaxID=183260 RepID=A0ABR2SET4_9ROSI
MVDNSACNPELVLAHKFSEVSHLLQWHSKDVAIYALGVGACGRDGVDTDELKYVYHENGQQFIKVLPTFSTLFSLEVMSELSVVRSLRFDARLMLHGQQYIEIYKPLPVNASIHNKVTLAGLHDKGKASVLELETRSYAKESGELLSMNRTSVFLRGAGGFSDPSKPFTYSNYPVNQTSMKIPKIRPFAGLYREMNFYDASFSASFELLFCFWQALLYRLSGDYNPLHSDPMIGKAAGLARCLTTMLLQRLIMIILILRLWLHLMQNFGLPLLVSSSFASQTSMSIYALLSHVHRFSRPILHGLCTLGFAARAIIRCICKGDPDMIKSIFARFLLHVYPGEALITEMWIEDLKVIYQVKVKERNREVLAGYVQLHQLAAPL